MQYSTIQMNTFCKNHSDLSFNTALKTKNSNLVTFLTKPPLCFPQNKSPPSFPLFLPFPFSHNSLSSFPVFTVCFYASTARLSGHPGRLRSSLGLRVAMSASSVPSNRSECTRAQRHTTLDSSHCIIQLLYILFMSKLCITVIII